MSEEDLFKTPLRSNLHSNVENSNVTIMTLHGYAEALTNENFHSNNKKLMAAVKLALSQPQQTFYVMQQGLSEDLRCMSNRSDNKTVEHLQSFLVHALQISFSKPETARNGIVYLLTSLLTNTATEAGYKWLMSAVGIPTNSWPAEEGTVVKDRKTAYRALFLEKLLGYDVSLFVENFDTVAYSEEEIDPSMKSLILDHLELLITLPDTLQPEWYEEVQQFWVKGLNDDHSTAGRTNSSPQAPDLREAVGNCS